MGEAQHASLSQTAFRRELIPFVRSCIPGTYPHPISIDLRMWWSKELEDHRKVLMPSMKNKLFVGFKAMPGRVGAGVGHDGQFYTPDSPDFRVLHDWCQDAKAYIQWIKK